MSTVRFNADVQCSSALDCAPSLPDLEIEIIDLFVQAAQLLNIPKSVGEIYGFLFVSPSAMPFEQIVSNLKISKGAASHGLKCLRSMGAVRVTYVMGDRRDHYLAESELRKLAAGFLREKVEHHLVNGQEKLVRLEQQISESQNREFMKTRYHQLKNWSCKAREILPLVTAFLGAQSDE